MHNLPIGSLKIDEAANMLNVSPRSVARAGIVLDTGTFTGTRGYMCARWAAYRAFRHVGIPPRQRKPLTGQHRESTVNRGAKKLNH